MVQLERFGKYEIVRKLGRSMTDVYLGRDTVLDRPVVLKLVELSSDPYTQLVAEAERRGAQIQKQLHDSDPRILEVYEYGEQDGCFYVAMEYFQGLSIAEILQRDRALDPRLAAAYAAEVCNQLERLHSFVAPEADGKRLAVVHGDIKPSNIQIGPNGEIRLLDFGIAKVITYTRNLTHHNLGSPTYCSPERLAKAQVDASADLWAVGVTLYEMVAGSPPYQAQSTRKLDNLIQSRRSPRALPKNVPPALRAIISKALAAELERRYQTAGEFEADLRAWLAGRPAAAESEKEPAWQANETVRKSRTEADLLRRAVGRLAEARGRIPWGFLRPREGVLWALGAGLLLGALILMPALYFYRFRQEYRPLTEPVDYSRSTKERIEADWNLYARLAREGSQAAYPRLPGWVAQSLRKRLMAAAAEVIEGYRNSSDPDLANSDWPRARQCLGHVLQMDRDDTEARGKLALADGYLTLIRNPRLPAAAAAEANFRMSARLLPRSPDPHLALAHVYTYSFHNAGRAMAELTEAERAGFHPGPRESEMRADGYLYRAESEIRRAQKAARTSKADEQRWLRQAEADLQRARAIYEPLSGYSNVDASLERLNRVSTSAAQLQEALQRASHKPRRAPPRKYYRSGALWR